MAHVLERQQRVCPDSRDDLPAGFERYFQEMVDLLQQGGPPDPNALAGLAERYGLEVDLASIPRLTEEYGLRFGPAADAT